MRYNLRGNCLPSAEKSSMVASVLLVSAASNKVRKRSSPNVNQFEN